MYVWIKAVRGEEIGENIEQIVRCVSSLLVLVSNIFIDINLCAIVFLIL